MAYSVQDVKSELLAILHGTTLNQIQQINPLFNRAARKLLGDVDPIETVRLNNLTVPIYQQVYDYPIPGDLKDDRIIDIRPQVNRQLYDRFFQKYNEEFDLYKTLVINEGQWSLQYNNSVKTVRIVKNDVPAPIVVNQINSIQGDGTWFLTGNANNLQVDNLVYATLSASLRFDITASTDHSLCSIENVNMQAIDLTRDWEQGVEFIYCYMPDPNVVYNCQLRWGSSPADYWENTVTTDFFGNAFAIGWNLLKFEWPSATITGNPIKTAITYARFSLENTGEFTAGFRVNSLTSQIGQIYEIEYYSKFLFRDSITGAFKENVTSDADLINLDTTSYNMFFNLVAYFAVQQQKSPTGTFDADYFLNQYETEKERYVEKIRSQIQKPIQNYYTMPPKKTYIARRW